MELFSCLHFHGNFSDWSISYWIFGYWQIFRVRFVIVICLGDWLWFRRNIETEWFIRRWRGYETTGTFAKVLSYLGSGNLLHLFRHSWILYREKFLTFLLLNICSKAVIVCVAIFIKFDEISCWRDFSA